MISDLKKIFMFPLKDKRWWVKILIGIVPIANVGYILNILRDAKDGREAVLPEWGNWEELFGTGFMALIIAICYAVPVMILSMFGIIPGIGFLFKFISYIAGFLLGPVITIALCKYIESSSLSSAFDFKAIYSVFMANMREYLIIALIFGLISAIIWAISIASLFIICLFPLILLTAFYVNFYLSIISARLYGELYRAKG